MSASRAPSPTVSLCMIVKNEERWLASCLESVRGVVDEMVVVDTGSNDATLEIARSFGARVFSHRWQGDFAVARNESLLHATGDWALVLDADEELERGAGTLLRGLIDRPEVEGYQVRVRSLLPAGDLLCHEDIHLTRLFRRRPQYRYEQAIHEQIRPAIERQGGLVVETSEITIVHHGYAQPIAQGGERRAVRNLGLLEAAVSRSPGDPYLWYQLGATYKSLGDNEKAEQALRAVLGMDWEGLGSGLVDKLHQKLAQLALGRQDYPAALRHARESLARNPENLASMYVAGLACIFQHDLHGGYDYFARLRAKGAGNLVDTADLDRVLAFCRERLGLRRQPDSEAGES
ncbi:MAG: glycosyltransferase [Sphingomonadaceae bacterium]